MRESKRFTFTQAIQRVHSGALQHAADSLSIESGRHGSAERQEIL